MENAWKAEALGAFRLQSFFTFSMFCKMVASQFPHSMLQKSYSPFSGNEIWGGVGSYDNLRKAIFYLLMGD